MGSAKAPLEVLCWLRKNSGGRKPCLIVMAQWLETLKLRLKICLLLPLRDWHPLIPLPGRETQASVLPRLGVLCPSLVFSWERLIPLLVGGSALSWGLDPVLCQPGTQRPLPTLAAAGTPGVTIPGTNSGGAEPGRRPAPGVVSAGLSTRRFRRGPTPPPESLAGPDVPRGKQEGVLGQLLCAHLEAPGAEAAVSFPSSGAASHLEPFLARSPARPGSGPPSPGEQDGAVLQWAAAHRLPALPDQLGLGALHARPGTRGARLEASGRETVTAGAAPSPKRRGHSAPLAALP